MSYARTSGTGHYIWHDDSNNQFNFNCYNKVNDDEMSIFLYKILLTRPNELKELIINGRQLVFNWLDKHGNEDNYKEWLLEKEENNQIYKTVIN